MKVEQLVRAFGDVKEKYIMEAEPMGNTVEHTTRRSERTMHIIKRSALAAVLALCLLIGGAALFAPRSMAVSAYAYGEEREITSSGAAFTTGSLNDRGELTGHPLMFHIAGEKIKTVRFSCKNEQINFMDLTEQRDEYGAAQNFTVPYGEDESEYSFLIVDWVPNKLISALRSGQYGSIAALPDEMRQDVIVMEFTSLSGRTATKAMNISLNSDGTVFAAFEDYKIREQDDFVKRADSEPVARYVFYEQGDITVKFCDDRGGEVAPDALWYNTYHVDHIAVRWSGRFADSVQMFFTPAGTETFEEMELLATRSTDSAENVMVFSAEALHREGLMGHLDFLIDLGGGCSIRSELYDVIYDPFMP